MATIYSSPTYRVGAAYNNVRNKGVLLGYAMQRRRALIQTTYNTKEPLFMSAVNVDTKKQGQV